MIRTTTTLLLFAIAAFTSSQSVCAFAPASFGVKRSTATTLPPPKTFLEMSSDDETFFQETPEATQERIQTLVDEYPVLLFMKGSKIFPQCGFSNTAVQILQTFNIEFHSVDVLADEAIRSGVKDFSQWPTIPQLYVAGEFIGGSDIMIEMYQSGELGEMIEKAKADMM
eukprot:CAMPEP_0185728314 /NCGR_PEP_ID=MMETSP1171-20130828/3698_1 /TAXON_ID=374046 /ORGANISM="Helicotheca tamensis, Strain CCMP826" /LENGTH=168 /DNA_ID=CAMNT_0028397005 /DNA_START=51 /DNA_END=557 /DNA_ORIENTATION=+